MAVLVRLIEGFHCTKAQGVSKQRSTSHGDYSPVVPDSCGACTEDDRMPARPGASVGCAREAGRYLDDVALAASTKPDATPRRVTQACRKTNGGTVDLSYNQPSTPISNFWTAQQAPRLG